MVVESREKTKKTELYTVATAIVKFIEKSDAKNNAITDNEGD